jgi:TolA-binding protein
MEAARRPRRRTKAALAVLLAVFGAGCSVNSAKKHYVLAEKLWTDGKYSASVAEFEKVTARDPKGKLGLQALLRGATTQSLFLSEYPGALKKFRTFTETSDDPTMVWETQKQIGEILFSKLEAYDQAETHYQLLLQQHPDAPEAPEFMFRVGRSQFYQWHFDDAVKTDTELARKYPATPWGEKAALEIGRAYFTRGEQSPGDHGPGMEQYKLATEAYEKFIKSYPESPLVAEAKFGIANCLEEQDQLDAAYNSYEALKASYPSPNVIEIKLARIRERKAQRSR